MKSRTFFTSLMFILLCGTFSLAAQNPNSISMTLPSSVVKEVISKSLPLEFALESNTLVGSLAIDKIENLQFKENMLSSHVTLTGHNLHIVTSIAGQALRMKIGTLTMSFQCDATLRFDAAKQTLYLKPLITKLQSTDQQKTDIAATVALLFNNREFPLQIEKLKPIVADAGNKLLNISMHITDVALQPGNLLLSIAPKITTQTKVK